MNRGSDGGDGRGQARRRTFNEAPIHESGKCASWVSRLEVAAALQ